LPAGPGSANMARMPSALLVDLYELTMASSYLRRAMTAPATFSLFVRRLPPQRGFLVAAGLEEVLGFLEDFHFDERDLSYLASQGFGDDDLAALAAVRFTGDVWAVPEGRVVVADEPLLEVTAPMPEAQLVETVLLNTISFHTALASKAARCVVAAQGRFELVDFAMRRTQGLEAALAVARTSALVGFSATSNVEAARRYGLVPSGTMAHSYIEAFDDETEAFRAFAADHPTRTTFLVDTYDTLTGVRNAIEVIREDHLEDRAAIRIDSGDLSMLSFEARRILDEAGLPGVKIVVSGSLDEHGLARLVAGGAPVDAAGVGTLMGVSADAPYLDSAYKLVSYAGRPAAKLSTDKATYPGAKQVFRGPGSRDVLGLRDEAAPAGSTPLLEHVMEKGRRRRLPEGLETQQERCRRDVSSLPVVARQLVDPVPPPVEVSAALAKLNEQVRAELEARELGRRPSV
jgi:nicotinate phosphoribosyltransferase